MVLVPLLSTVVGGVMGLREAQPRSFAFSSFWFGIWAVWNEESSFTVCPADAFLFCEGCRSGGGVCDQGLGRMAVLPDGSEQAGLLCVQAVTAVFRWQGPVDSGLAPHVDMDTSLLKLQS